MPGVASLLGRRFAPLFLAQLAGAFHDNLVRSALIVGVTFGSLPWAAGADAAIGPLALGLFVAPFIVLSASAGQLSERVGKPALVRALKLLELPIAVVVVSALLDGSVPRLLLALLALGVRAAAFGPVRYAVLPELLAEDERVAGHAALEAGTLAAIFAGTIAGGLAADRPVVAAGLAAAAAALGLLAALAIPARPAVAPALRLAPEPLTPFVEAYRAVATSRPLLLCCLGLSWFWFIGAAILAVLPAFTRLELGGGPGVLTLLLGIASGGLALGALLAGWLSRGRAELGLVPLGALGLSGFLFDLALASPGAGPFSARPGAWRILVDLAGVALASGLFTVPLYAFLEERSRVELRSRVAAANNALNAVFMVLAALLVFALGGAPTPWLFVVLALMNLGVAAFMYQTLPEFALRLVVFGLARLAYRLRATGAEHIPREGAAVLVANHVTFVDWLFIAAAVKRPARFVMYHTYFKMPVVGWLFRDAKVIPIAPAHEDRGLLEEAFDRIAAELEAGDLVCIFPEGKLTKDGRLNVFRTGIERIVARTPVPVVPMALIGLWGSTFSRKRGGRRGFFGSVELRVGPPVPAVEVRAADLRARVASLGGLEFAPDDPSDAVRG